MDRAGAGAGAGAGVAALAVSVVVVAVVVCAQMEEDTKVVVRQKVIILNIG